MYPGDGPILLSCSAGSVPPYTFRAKFIFVNVNVLIKVAVINVNNALSMTRQYS